MTLSTLPIIATLAFIFLTASPSASPASSAAVQAFIQCFLKKSETSSDVLYTSTSTAYEFILESQAQNMRLLASKTNQKPSAIVAATTESHISETVKCAHKHGLQLRTRSGGHDYEGMSYVADNKEKPFVVETLLDRPTVHVDSIKAKSDFLTELVTEAQWEEIWGALKGKGVSFSMIMEPLRGWMSNISESEIAFPHRKGFAVMYSASWAESDEEEDRNQLNSMRELYSFMTPYVSSSPRSAYYGDKDIDLGSADYEPDYDKAREWGERYFKGNFERLAIVKARVDPLNFFRNEQSIPPSKYDRISTSTTSSSFED